MCQAANVCCVVCFICSFGSRTILLQAAVMFSSVLFKDNKGIECCRVMSIYTSCSSIECVVLHL